MPRRVREVISQTWQSEVNLSCFLALLVLTAFILPSIGFEKNDERLYGAAASSVMFISGALIAWRQRAVFLVAAIIVGSAIVVRWATWLYPRHAFGIWPDLMDAGAVAMIIFILLSQVFAVGPITGMRIQGAIAAYLGFGGLWARAFAITASIHPGSFSGPGSAPSSAGDWLYYSFVTLTTVGYGDIVPISMAARSLAMGEALTGQLYLAVLLAHLVSMRVSGAGNAGNSSPK